MRIPKPNLICELRPETVDKENRRVDVTFYSGAQIPRFSWDRGRYLLTFLTGAENIRLDSLKSGRAPICDSLDSLRMSGQIGVIESGEICNGGWSRSAPVFQRRSGGRCDLEQSAAGRPERVDGRLCPFHA